MDNPNNYSANSLSSSFEKFLLGGQNTLGERGQRVGSPPTSSARSDPQLPQLTSMSRGDPERSTVMPFRPSHALQGFNFGLPSTTTMDRLPALGSSGSLNSSSLIRAPEQGMLPDITEDYLRLGFVSDDLSSTIYPTQESSSLLGSNSSSTAYHLNPADLHARETPYDVGDIEQRGCSFYGNNLGRFATQRSPYVGTPSLLNPVWSSGSSYAMFDGSEASSSRSNQDGCLSSITGQCSYEHQELNSVSGNPFLNTLSGGSGFCMDEVDAMKRSIYLGVMNDEHGRHLFDLLLSICSYEVKLEIVSLVARADELLELAKDCNGNDSVKKLIQSIKGLPDLCDLVTSALSKIVGDLMNQNLGFSLIDCCLNHLTYKQNSFIFEEARRNCNRLARNQKGVFTLNLCIAKSDMHHRMKIVEELVQDTIGLAQDPYGNFAIQSVLSLEDLYFDMMICNQVAEHLAELSQHKTGSYVVESCLESSQGNLLLQKLENFPDEVLEEIAIHPFGNYVLQKALKVEKEKWHHPTLVHKINRILKNLRTYPYTTNIIKLARRNLKRGHDFTQRS